MSDRQTYGRTVLYIFCSFSVNEKATAVCTCVSASYACCAMDCPNGEGDGESGGEDERRLLGRP